MAEIDIFNPNNLDPDKIPHHLRFSPSGLDTYDTCLKRGYYLYKRGFRTKSTERYLRLGSIIHKMLELYYKGTSIAELPSTLEEFPTAEDQMLMYSALGLLYRYEQHYGPLEKNWTINAIEQYVIIPYTTPKGNHVYLNGIIDMIIEEHGNIMVVDHKSGAKFWTADQVYFDRQLMIYAYMLHTIGFTPKRLLINNINTTPSACKNTNAMPTDRLFSRIPVPLNVKRIEGYMNIVGQNIDRILETSEFTYSTGKHCSTCPFREACAMEFEGIDPEPYLQTNFKSGEVKPFSIVIEGLEF